MFERTRYVRDIDGSRVGVVTILYENGKFGAGMSLCRTDEDKFDCELGKQMAKDRALQSMNNSHLLLKDLTQATCFHRVARVTGCEFPQTKHMSFETEDRIVDAVGTFIVTVQDMIYTLALSKVKSETV